MEFKNDELNTSFVIPEPVTVKKMMAFMSVYATAQNRDIEFIEIMWRAAKIVITDWKSPYLADIDADLEQETNPAVYDLLLWASTTVRNYIQSLERIPKN